MNDEALLLLLLLLLMILIEVGNRPQDRGQRSEMKDHQTHLTV